MEKTLYSRLGGEEAIALSVEKLFELILSDDDLKGFFDGLDMIKQKDLLTKFLCVGFGGKSADYYKGRNMYEAHKKLREEQGLKEIHFTKVCNHLVAVLKELGVKQPEIDEICEIAGTLKPQILGHIDPAN